MIKLPCSIIAGGQRGDEGKGKIAAYLVLEDRPEIVCRAGVGPNAGHTIIWKGEELEAELIGVEHHRG